MKTLFVHGVPDTANMWSPLLPHLGLEEAQTVRLSLPGFSAPVPDGFGCTKDEYADWLIEQMAYHAGEGGQVRLVGHDWGALLTLRAASLRPDLVKSFVVANALIDGQYKGHRMARLWATPVLGEAAMASWRFMKLGKVLQKAGMPESIVDEEASAIDARMRGSILKLYRSATGLRFSGEWVADLRNLPQKGCVIWGEHDPFVGIEVAERFQREWRYPLHILKDCGHWGIVEAPEQTGAFIQAFWKSV